jgi:hypothetical protein
VLVSLLREKHDSTDARGAQILGEQKRTGGAENAVFFVSISRLRLPAVGGLEMTGVLVGLFRVRTSTGSV